LQRLDDGDSVETYFITSEASQIGDTHSITVSYETVDGSGTVLQTIDYIVKATVRDPCPHSEFEYHENVERILIEVGGVAVDKDYSAIKYTLIGQNVVPPPCGDINVRTLSTSPRDGTIFSPTATNTQIIAYSATQHLADETNVDLKIFLVDYEVGTTTPVR